MTHNIEHNGGSEIIDSGPTIFKTYSMINVLKDTVIVELDFYSGRCEMVS